MKNKMLLACTLAALVGGTAEASLGGWLNRFFGTETGWVTTKVGSIDLEKQTLATLDGQKNVFKNSDKFILELSPEPDGLYSLSAYGSKNAMQSSRAEFLWGLGATSLGLLGAYGLYKDSFSVRGSNVAFSALLSYVGCLFTGGFLYSGVQGLRAAVEQRTYEKNRYETYAEFRGRVKTRLGLMAEAQKASAETGGQLDLFTKLFELGTIRKERVVAQGTQS